MRLAIVVHTIGTLVRLFALAPLTGLGMAAWYREWWEALGFARPFGARRAWSAIGWASTLSTRLPSRSTTSKRQPSHSTASAVRGSRPSSSITMPASVL